MNVGIIGAGHITHALAEGWERPGVAGAPRLCFCDVVAGRAEELAAAVGGSAAPTIPELVAGSDVVIVAVRPQHVAGVLRELGPHLGDRSLVSVAAGVPVERLLADLPQGARAARIMPTVAAAIGVGVAVFVPGTLAAQGQEDVRRLFSLGGTVLAMDEELFDVATAVSGCMPGMLATIIESFAAAAVSQGVELEVARTLALEGVHGAAAVIARSGDPAAVRDAVATPGGVTAAAVAALTQAGIDRVLDEAVVAGTRRAKELT
jgi:pyrroline-5-carboxylate reductase